MELSKQVVSLELAKRLKELGVKQESLFWWAYTKQFDTWTLEFGKRQTKKGFMVNDVVSAFTVAELGERLHKKVITEESLNPIEGYRLVAYGKDKYREYAATEADVRAKILIYLRENNLLTKE